jgi:glycerate-2-kinase
VIVKNRDKLSVTKLRKQALDIIESGIERVLPPNIMKASVRYDAATMILSIQGDSYPLSSGRIFVIGGGKASCLMAETLESILFPGSITVGWVNCKGGRYRTHKIKTVTAGHPLPDQRGIEGVGRMLSLKQQYAIGKGDLVICLISGGGSALMPCPVHEVSLKDKQRTTELLLGSGAEIAEINVVRKHLSRTKGGRLGQYFSPATVVSLILSDVIGNDLGVIASGPTFPDSSTFSDALGVLSRYDLLDGVPEQVTEFLKKGCRGEVAETPKTLSNCYNYIIGDSKLALAAMRKRAIDIGLSPYIVTAEQKGETTAVAQTRANEMLNGRYDGYDAVLIGGETTPKLPSSPGRGGRNQHYAAISMLAMQPYPGDWLVASVGTDGSDFLPDVAGAIVDHRSLDKTGGLDVSSYLDRYDSNTLLGKIGDSLVVTGDTGTNVGDVMVYLTG